MQLGPYELLDELGRGGVGVVFRARGPRGEEVAVKILAKVQGDALARFDRERRLAGAFTAREGFVPLLDAGTAPEGPYLVMPLVSGGTLRDRLKKGPFNVEQTLALGRALAHAIGLAHARGIVHRDLKPENVLFDGEGRPLIADLGLAKHFANDAPGASQSLSLSRAGALRGTAGYMAPEQAADARSAGPAADVFALGAILHECLSGRAAFQGESLFELLGKVAEGRVEPLVGVPGWLAAVIDKALAKDPARRYSDGAALGEALTGKRVPRRGPVLLAVVVLGLVASGWAVRAHFVRAAVVKARAALVAKDHATARRCADEALALDASNAAAWCVRGDARRAAGDFKGAFADLTRAIELDPTDALAWTVRGDVNSELEQFDAAVSDTTRALALAPDLARAWKERGVARSRKNDLVGALRDLDRALELDVTNGQAWYNRGHLRQTAGDDKGAISDLTRAIEVEPGVARYWIVRASSRISLGDLDGVIEDCTKAFSLDPKEGHVLCMRGFAKAKRGDHVGAVRDYDRGLAIDGTVGVNWMNRGVSRAELNDTDGVLADEDRAIALDPTLHVAFYFRAGARSRKGDFAGAADDLERYLQLNPKAVDAESTRQNIIELRAQAEQRGRRTRRK